MKASEERHNGTRRNRQEERRNLLSKHGYGLCSLSLLHPVQGYNLCLSVPGELALFLHGPVVLTDGIMRVRTVDHPTSRTVLSFDAFIGYHTFSSRKVLTGSNQTPFLFCTNLTTCQARQSVMNNSLFSYFCGSAKGRRHLPATCVVCRRMSSAAMVRIMVCTLHMVRTRKGEEAATELRRRWRHEIAVAVQRRKFRDDPFCATLAQSATGMARAARQGVTEESDNRLPLLEPDNEASAVRPLRQ